MTATIHESPVQVKQAPAAIAVSGLVDLADGHAFVRTAGYRRRCSQWSRSTPGRPACPARTSTT